MRLTVSLCAATLLSLMVFVTPSRAASTTTDPDIPLDNGVAVPPGAVVNSWALTPARLDDPQKPGNRSSFSYTVSPGQIVTDQATLFNLSNVTLLFRVYATDAFNDADGGFSLLPGDAKPKDLGKWIEIPQENISLAPRQQVTFPITIRIPRGASPGDHAGAILASSAATGTGPDGSAVSVDRRTGSRVYMRVAGKLTRELSISKVKTTYRPSINPFTGKVDVAYTIENTGNVRLTGKHRVSVHGPFGLAKKNSALVDLNELLPGQSFTAHASFGGTPAALLEFAKATVDPVDSGGQTIPSDTRGAATLAVPWTIVALGLIAYLLRFSRRSYRRRNEAATAA